MDKWGLGLSITNSQFCELPYVAALQVPFGISIFHTKLSKSVNNERDAGHRNWLQQYIIIIIIIKSKKWLLRKRIPRTDMIKGWIDPFYAELIWIQLRKSLSFSHFHFAQQMVN